MRLLLLLFCSYHAFSAIDTSMSRHPPAKCGNLYVQCGCTVDGSGTIRYFIANSTNKCDWIIAYVRDSYVLIGVKFLGDRFVVYGYEILQLYIGGLVSGRVIYSKTGGIKRPGGVLRNTLDSSWHYGCDYNIALSDSTGWGRPFVFSELRIIPGNGTFMARGAAAYHAVTAPDTHGYAQSYDSCRTWRACTAYEGQTAWKAASDSWIAPVTVERRKEIADNIQHSTVSFDILGRRIRGIRAQSVYMSDNGKRIIMR